MLILKSVVDLSGYTLVIPAASIGNVGQLAVDLMISTLDCTLLGEAWHPAILPGIGKDPFLNMASALQCGCFLYKNDTHKLVLVQFRAPLCSKQVNDLLKKLLVWVKSCAFAKVVIFAGSTYSGGCDSLIAGVKLRYLLTNDLLSVHKADLEKMYWLEAPRESGKVFMPASGCAKSLFFKLEEAGIPSAMLVKYCSEGDNIPDAMELANYANGWMKIVETTDQWRMPNTWSHFFGRKPMGKRIF